jgi:cytochrome c oxidase subunit 2
MLLRKSFWSRTGFREAFRRARSIPVLPQALLVLPRALLLLPVLAAAPALAQAKNWPFSKWQVPDVSKDGWRPEALFWYTTLLCVIAFTLVVAALVAFSLKYRARPGHAATYDHGTSRTSYAITAVLAAIVFILIDINLVRVSQADIGEYLFKWPVSADTVKVEIMPQQWAWNVRYAGPDGVFNTPDDIVTLNEMRVPVGHPVMVNLKAKDVIHSFYLPHFRLKHDANPGTVTRTWFTPLKEGKFEIACSQMCGWAHYKMRGELTVMAEKDFARWMKDAEGDARRRFDPADKEQLWGWEWVQ